MGNLLLTSYCNRRCSYCFAKDKIEGGESRREPDVSADSFRVFLDWAERSRMESLSLLGGEPTLHPAFADYMREIVRRGVFAHVKLFTNGLIPDRVVEFLGGLDARLITLVLNVNEPAEYSAGEWKRLEKTLQALHDRTVLGFNLYRAECDFSFMLGLYEKHRLRPHVRFGMAQPILGAENVYLPTEAFPAVAAKLVAAAREWTPKGLYFSFDCGFPFCMFTLEQHAELLRCGIPFRSLCDPVVDVGTDLRVWRCFPHATCGEQTLDQFDVRADAVKYFSRQDRAFGPFGIYDRCLDCVYRKQGLCCGGCLSRTKRLFRGAAAGPSAAGQPPARRRSGSAPSGPAAVVVP